MSYGMKTDNETALGRHLTPSQGKGWEGGGGSDTSDPVPISADLGRDKQLSGFGGGQEGGEGDQ